MIVDQTNSKFLTVVMLLKFLHKKFKLKKIKKKVKIPSVTLMTKITYIVTNCKFYKIEEIRMVSFAGLR